MAPSTSDTSLLEHTSTTGRCGWCEKPLPEGLRPEAEYCDKRCRQAASRRRVRARGPVPDLVARERCAWCEKPLPAGRRPEAEYCDKRCRQASSRFGLAVKRSAAPADSDTSRKVSPRSRPHDASRRAGPRAAEQPSGLADVSDTWPALAHEPFVLDVLGDRDRRVLQWRAWSRATGATSFRLPPELLVELAARATAIGETQAHIVMAAITSLLDQDDERIAELCNRVAQALLAGRRSQRRTQRAAPLR